MIESVWGEDISAAPQAYNVLGEGNGSLRTMCSSVGSGLPFNSGWWDEEGNVTVAARMDDGR